jgi:hypothetical protein
MTASPASVPGVLQHGAHSARPAATDVASGAIYACSTHLGTIYVSDGSTWSAFLTPALSGTGSGLVVALSFIIDGSGATITTGDKGSIEIPYACTISANRLLADASGSIVVDIKKAAYSGLPPSSSICASAKPTLSSAQKSQDSTLTGWTTAVAAGDWLLFHVDSATTVQRVTLSLTLTRT